MTDRVVKVSLLAQVSNYVAGMEQARKSTVSAGKSAEDAKAKFEQQNQTMTQIGTGMLAVGAIAAVGVGLAIKKFADFDAAMSEVQASTHESAANMGLLRDAAIEAGASTVFTATEAANAIDELAKAGVSTADVLGGALAGSLDLASAGGLGVAEAASIAATALTQFKLKGAEIPHVADLLAAGAGKAQGSVDDLGQALKQGGLVASQAGMSLDETTGALAAFASAGLIGSDAGTALKTMLLALEKPSAQAAGLMKQYGISVYDSQGKMLGFSDIAGQLKDKLGGLTEEQRNSTLATIFGTDAVRSAAVLYDQGATGIQKWNDKVNDAGYAAETARIKLDNLNGDVEKLGGSFDTALIKSGSGANDSLRFLVQTATELMDVFNSAPPIVQQAALGLGVVAAGALLTGGAFLVGVPKIALFGASLATLSQSQIPGVAAAAVKGQAAVAGMAGGLGKAAAFMMGPWGLAIAAAAVGVALLSKYLDSLKASSTEVGNSLATASDAAQIFATIGKGRDITAWRDVTAQLKDLPTVLQAAADQSGNLFARFDSTNFGAFNALKDLGAELGSLATTDLPGAQKAFRMLTDETDGSEKAQWRLLNTMPGYKDALTAQAKTLGINVTSTDEAANKTALLGLAFGDATPTALTAADAYLAAADASGGLNDQIKTLIETINTANGVGQDAASANAAYQKSIADVADYIKKAKAGVDGFSLGMDKNTVAGSANIDMLAQHASTAQASAKATFDADGNMSNYRATLEAGHKAVYDSARALGANAAQAQAVADNLAGIPSETDFKVIADTQDAAKKVEELTAAIRATPDKMVTITEPLSPAVIARLQKLGYTVDHLPNGNVRITSSGASAVEETLRNLTRERTSTIALHYRVGPPPKIPSFVMNQGPDSAFGGILPGAPSSKDNMFIHAASGEFVTRASQTAIPANRAALEFMNRGGVINGYAGGGYVQPVQYVQPSGSWGAPQGGGGSTATNKTVQMTVNYPVSKDPVESVRELGQLIGAGLDV